MSEPANAINVYTCPECGWQAITINRVEGTTPFQICCEGNCRASGWNGGAYSSFYQVDQSLTPTHEWYRPTTAGERKKLRNPDTREHVALGGLLIRELPAPARKKGRTK